MKKVIYSFIALLMISAGCKKSFFDINENPNSPTEEAMQPNLLLSAVLNSTAKKMAINYDFAAHWMGYWTRSGSYGQSNPLENYDITTSYQRNNWVNSSTLDANPVVSWYDILKDNNVMEKKAQESGDMFYVAAAKVVKSIGYMYLVDIYNNVPYTEAFDLEGHITPAYDKGEDIYKDLLLQLDEAAKMFAAIDNAGVTASEADILFEGDLEMWRKLVNTQRLKLLIRQSQVFGAAVPTEELAKITADGSGFLMSGETANVNPGYAVDKYKQNPFYNAYKKDETGTLVDNFNRANNYILNKYRDNNDIRYTYVFSKAQTPVGGNDYWGYDFGFIDTDPDAPKGANSSDIAGPGLAKSATQAQWLFTSVESLFLQAEAIQRGWLTGDAKAVYEAAVTESFIWLGVENATVVAKAYLTQVDDQGNTNPLVDWSNPANTNKINLIVMQKYMALTGINNFEAWVDYRRLGVPTDLPLSLSPSRGGRKVPLRLLYPQEEYNYNAANVAAQGTIDAQSSTIFWDK